MSVCVFFHGMTDSDFSANLGEFVLIWFSLFQKYDIICALNLLKQLIPMSNGISKQFYLSKNGIGCLGNYCYFFPPVTESGEMDWHPGTSYKRILYWLGG